MNSNRNVRHTQPHISDELLSAFLDGEVSALERSQIEEALASDPDTAWRLDALRQTVTLVKALPRVSLPRSFTLSEADLVLVRTPSFWQRLFANPPALRNAAALATVLFLALFLGDLMSYQRAARPAPSALQAKQVESVVVLATVLNNATPAAPQSESPMKATEALTPAAAMIAPSSDGGPGASVPAPAPTIPASDAFMTLAAPTLTAEAPVAALKAPAVAPTESAPAAPPTPAPGSGVNWLRMAQAALALLAIGLFMAWRRSHLLLR